MRYRIIMQEEPLEKYNESGFLNVMSLQMSIPLKNTVLQTCKVCLLSRSLHIKTYSNLCYPIKPVWKCPIQAKEESNIILSQWRRCIDVVNKVDMLHVLQLLSNKSLFYKASFPFVQSKCAINFSKLRFHKWQVPAVKLQI